MAVPLRSFLHTEDFNNRLVSLESYLSKNFFRFWQAHAPHYTDHGETHCKAVEMNLDELMPEDVKKQLNEYEIFLLLCSVFLHDIGIMCATKTAEEDQKIRETHHERTKQFMVDNLKELFNSSERFIIGALCYAHRDCVEIKEIEDTKILRHESLGNKEIRVRFLAALLRLADSCDLCYTRTSSQFISASRIPEENAFYHALHERISGISFNSEDKTIYIDFGVTGENEKPICKEFVLQKLQESLNSVKDILTRYGVIYIDVIPRFAKIDTLTIELTPPKASKKKLPQKKLRPSEALLLQRKAWFLYLKKKNKQSLTLIKKSLRKDPNDSMSWYIKGRVYEELKNFKQAAISLKKAVDLEPNNVSYLNAAGHHFGENLLDIKRSFQYFKKAYQLSPRDEMNSLNYAEALVTVGKVQEGYNLATAVWNQTTDILIAFNANVIRIYSLFLLGRHDEGAKELKNLLLLLRGAPPTLKKSQEWIFNKIRKYVSECLTDDNIKQLLDLLIDLASLKVSISEFSKKYKKHLK